jgi:sec-independent protein translocase protein TatC
VLAYEIYRFVDPALYPHERQAVYPFVVSFSVMFVIGAAFGYRILTPFMIWALFPFFTAVGAERIISIMDFYNMVFVSTMLSGLIFTWPVFFVILVRFGVLQTSMISKNRKYVYAGMYIVAAFLTPDGGPLGDLLLFLPMLALTEIAVFIAKRYEKPKPIGAAPVTTTPRCKFCAAEIEPGRTFCDTCGRAQL